MEKNKKNILIICIMLLVLVFIPATENFVHAEINYDYGESSNNITMEENPSTDSDGDFGKIGATLLGILGAAIYGIGILIEWIVAGLVWLLTKNFVFPWADKIIFNTISILDINFINPSVGSLFRDSSGFTTIGTTVRNIYFTALSVALGFLGVVVAVMAIKLAISAIASDKAKYKEAIVTWLTAMVMLFGMHFLISFIFYLNEEMVKLASSIVTNSLGSVTIDGSSTDTSQAIMEMGEYFGNKVMEDVDGLFTIGEADLVAAILYCVLIIQSVMFFIAYFKRLFMVTILSLLAPFVVVYDFFVKAML